MICERCGTGFAPRESGGSPVRYCSKTCKRAAKAKRARQRDILAACAERDKQAWTDEHAATLAAARYEQQFGGHRYPYECACGWWHLTKVHPDDLKRAANIKLILFGEKP